MKNLELNDDQKKLLLKIARETIENTVMGFPPVEYDINDPVLKTECGAFVTIHNKGDLRGCIGNITASTPLWRTVLNMAVEASTRDPRFPPVNTREIDDIDIEISALSPLWRIEDINEIEVGTHGILIKKGFNQGLLLPQVAIENGFDRTSFLEHTCLKAGLPRNCYRDKGCEILIFSAIVFGEQDMAAQEPI
jgi:AmmeMemoRadiSam system protein A